MPRSKRWSAASGRAGEDTPRKTRPEAAFHLRPGNRSEWQWAMSGPSSVNVLEHHRDIRAAEAAAVAEDDLRPVRQRGADDVQALAGGIELRNMRRAGHETLLHRQCAETRLH